MATLRLNETRVDALKPRKSTYDIRDRELKGFGVRVLPSGAKRYFIHSQHRGRRVWKIVGQTESIGVEEARARTRVMLASIRNGTDEQAAALILPHRIGPPLGYGKRRIDDGKEALQAGGDREPAAAG